MTRNWSLCEVKLIGSCIHAEICQSGKRNTATTRASDCWGASRSLTGRRRYEGAGGRVKEVWCGERGSCGADRERLIVIKCNTAMQLTWFTNRLKKYWLQSSHRPKPLPGYTVYFDHRVRPIAGWEGVAGFALSSLAEKCRFGLLLFNKSFLSVKMEEKKQRYLLDLRPQFKQFLLQSVIQPRISLGLTKKEPLSVLLYMLMCVHVHSS